MGGLLLFFSSLTLIEMRASTPWIALYVAAGAFLALAIGSVLADHHRQNRPV